MTKACKVLLMAALLTISSIAQTQIVKLRGDAGGKRFDGIGIVNGGGATSVLLKDYPEPQRSQILDLVFKPKFGASVSALLVEIPGDGNSTQGSMPSHMHTRNDLNYTRGYTWWILREAKKRNPNLTLDGTAWSAPGWIGNGEFWSQDAADYYVKWLQGLRSLYGLEFDAIGVRNERGVNFDFVKMLRTTLDGNGFKNVKIHAFDNWPENKLDFVNNMQGDEKLRNSIDIIGAHTLQTMPASAKVQAMASRMNKPIWNTEEHVYKKGFDGTISIVEAFNENFIRSGATKIVNWYDVAGVYPIEPYSEDPAMILARTPWSGSYKVREALWGYAHYGQFTEVGWQYLNGGSGELSGGGTFITLKSPGNDYSVIIETKEAKAPQEIRFEVSGGLSQKDLCVWRSNTKEQFVRQADLVPMNGSITLTLEPNSIYSLSTTRGQQKGSFSNIPATKPFPFPYYETFDGYATPEEWGFLPHYTADIAGAFELAECPGRKGKCLHQPVPIPTLSWAPDWRPYTILGEDSWQNYEVSSDVYLSAGETAGVMGRINHVGSGWGIVPKGYLFELGAYGKCSLNVVRGIKEQNQPAGDAEQQALIKAGKDEGEGGEKNLGTIRLPGTKPNTWHSVKLRFDGTSITGFVDGNLVLRTTDRLYSHGVAGLIVGGGETFSMPYFDNFIVKGLNTPIPRPSISAPGQLPIYGIKDPLRRSTRHPRFRTRKE